MCKNAFNLVYTRENLFLEISNVLCPIVCPSPPFISQDNAGPAASSSPAPDLSLLPSYLREDPGQAAEALAGELLRRLSLDKENAHQLVLLARALSMKEDPQVCFPWLCSFVAFYC